MPSGPRPSFRGIGQASFKRSLLGYRRREVDRAIAERDGSIAERDRELSRCREQGAEREAQIARRDAMIAACDAALGTAGAELASAQRRIEQQAAELESLRPLRSHAAEIRAEREQAMAALLRLADELEQVRRQARGQATRIRLRALRDAVELADRIAELSLRPAHERERLFGALAEAIRRLGASVEGAGDASARANGNRAAVQAADSRRPARVVEPDPDVFDGLVEVEIGPLSDFSKLVGFEDAASGIDAASAISVKRFARGRATLEMSLREPVALLRELEQRAPFEFRVRDQRFDRLILDVDE